MLDIHIHRDRRLLAEVAKLNQLIRLLGENMSQALDRLTAEVEETKTVAQSAITLIEGLAQQIRDSADDPAKLNALADELDAKTNELGAAVTANTPAE